MAHLYVLLAVFVALVLPTTLVWWLGRRAGAARWMVGVFLLAGWSAVFVGWGLSQRAQPFLFPDTSPCYATGSAPVSRYFPPDSFCRHADGALRTVNGTTGRAVFWAAATVTVSVAAAFVLVRRRQRRA